MLRRQKKIQRPNSPLQYPEGLAVETESDTYLIKRGKKYRFFNERVFQSWKMVPVLGSDIALSKYLRAGVLGFRDGTLIHNFADGKIYLVSGNKLRHITNPDVFERYNLDPALIIRVSKAEAELHDIGEDLD